MTGDGRDMYVLSLDQPGCLVLLSPGVYTSEVRSHCSTPMPISQRVLILLLFSVLFCSERTSKVKQILCPVEEGVQGMPNYLE